MLRAKNLLQFIGAGVPFGLSKIAHKLCSRLWAELDIVPIALRRDQGRYSSGRKSSSNWDIKCVDEQSQLPHKGQMVTSQVNNLVQAMTQQLGQVRQELQSGVASSGQLASDAQRDVAQRLQSSTEALLQMSHKIGEMHQTSQDLSKATQTLQSVLGGAKTRGTLGEVTLDRLLADALPQSAYATQYRFLSTGAIVDAIVRSGERILTIDSKFPLDAYRRLVECGDDARRDFSMAVRKHADSIAEKYILPAEHTFDYALMFVPSEGVYYELLMTHDSKYGRLDEYCREKRVFPVIAEYLLCLLERNCHQFAGPKDRRKCEASACGNGGIEKTI